VAPALSIFWMNRLAYPHFSIPSNNTYIEWLARVLFYIRVRYDEADRERQSSHVWADASITKHQVIGIFVVVQYYKHQPKRLSWSWGPLAELFQRDQWEMGASSLVPVSAKCGQFILGPLDSAADTNFEFEIKYVMSTVRTRLNVCVSTGFKIALLYDIDRFHDIAILSPIAIVYIYIYYIQLCVYIHTIEHLSYCRTFFFMYNNLFPEKTREPKRLNSWVIKSEPFYYRIVCVKDTMINLVINCNLLYYCKVCKRLHATKD
jgi:hypothetical protein